ncbi:MAG: UbiH/UbiF family hydroxylase [Hyphomicrobiales bacterium]
MADAVIKANVVVVGAGPLGLMAALALAKSSNSIVLIGPKAPVDGRTTAILNEGVSFLEQIGVWDALQTQTAPLRIMRLVDGTNRLIRAPEASFDANELDLPAFGYNVKNNDLLTVLQNAINENANIKWYENLVEECTLDEAPHLTLDNGTRVEGSLIVAADGRGSRLRDAAGIETKTWQYPQTALVMNLRHTRDHQNASTEFHTETGPFTLVPLPGKQSSLVWVETPEKAAELKTLPLEELSALVSEKSHHLLGDVTVQNKPMAYPLSGLTALEYGRNKVVLIGESAHVFPPIGAQGMNLGIRDIKVVSELLEGQTINNAGEVDALVDQYSAKRKIDISVRTRAVDALNRSLLTDLLPVHLGRGLGLYALNKIPSARKFVMRQGLGAR